MHAVAVLLLEWDTWRRGEVETAVSEQDDVFEYHDVSENDAEGKMKDEIDSAYSDSE